MIAVALFAVAVVSLIGIYPASVRAARQSHGHLAAVNLAEKELEFSRAMNYESVQDRAKDYKLILKTNGAQNEIDFVTKVTVSQVPSRTGLKRVKVTVAWVGTDRIARELMMETYVAKLSP